MDADDKLLNTAIRHWLTGHPLMDGSELDVHGVPATLFDQAVRDERLRQLNRQILALPVVQQKLLKYLSNNIEPSLIIETLEYASPELFWLDKALLVKEVDPSARQQDVIAVFDANESLVAEIIRVSDQMEEEAEKSRNRRFRKWSVIAAPVILIVLFVIIYPMLFHPDPVALYDRYIGRYLPAPGTVDSLSAEGATFYDGLDMMDESRFQDATVLFTQIVQAGGKLQQEARWFLSLSLLRAGDADACAAQLRVLQSEDPGLWDKVDAGSLMKKVSR